MRVIAALVSALVFFTAPLLAEPIRLVSNAGAINNQALGFALREVYRRAGLEMTITPIPAKRAAHMLDNGEFDGVVGRVSGFGDTRPDLIRLEPPINTIITTAFILPERGHRIESRDDLKDKTVGVVRGIVHSRRAAAGAADMIEVDRPEQLFLMLKSNRIDVAVHGAFSSHAEVELLTDYGIVLSEIPIGTINSHHFLRDTFRQEAAAVASILREMVDEGEFGMLFQIERARLIAGTAAREPGN
ncbi:ABC transporter substrate-binding protein [uncultured Roseobacter sp.]|uniref:substrate-binding periplasmic protein n=1 Tax=uncultured Roseobacter sp. TaxID=114847 RepID=UPI00261FEED5|nr:transporter substrate-binding domain-containing protein [uncultured Roseobacter sp.]